MLWRLIEKVALFCILSSMILHVFRKVFSLAKRRFWEMRRDENGERERESTVRWCPMTDPGTCYQERLRTRELSHHIFQIYFHY